MRKLMLMLVVCAIAVTASGAIVELNDAQLAGFVNSGWDSGNSHVASDIPGDPGVQWDITYSAHSGWAGYDMIIYPTDLSAFGTNDVWEITIKNLSPYYVYVKPYMRADDGDAAWNYIYGDEGYLDPAGTASPYYLGDTFTFSVTNPHSVVRDLIIQTDVPGPDAGWTNNLPAAGGVISLQVIPEPATIALLGLGGLVLRRRRNA